MTKTSLSSIAVASIKEELTTARTKVAELKLDLAKMRRLQKDMRIDSKAKRAAAKELKSLDRAEKKAARIAKLESKLLALKVGKVGSIAIKTNKRPSACTTVYQMAA